MRRPHGLHAALGFFTVVPVPSFGEVDGVVGARAMRWFGVVGLLLGAAAALVFSGVAWLGGPPLLAATLALATLALLTGGLHLDGIADTADGLGSRKSPEAALALMKKSDVGPMGVAALVFVLLVQVATLAELGRIPGFAQFALVCGPGLGRVVLLGATQPSVPMAPSSSFGALFGGVTPPWHAVVGSLIAVMATGVGGWFAAHVAHGWVQPGRMVAVSVVAALVAIGVASLWRRHLVKRLGGLTGDMLGSILELTTTCWWLLLVLSPRLLGR